MLLSIFLVYIKIFIIVILFITSLIYYKGTSPPADMRYHGDRAMDYFKCVVKRTGTWDLVLPKYLEMAAWHSGESEVWDALKTHASNNRDNHLAFM